MSDDNFISDSLVYSSFQLGSLNLINAPCGSGKTTAAFQTIPNYLNIEPRRSLILINSVSGAEEFVKNDLAYFFDYNGKEWDSYFLPQYDKPTTMTYAAFGAKCKKQELDPHNYDYIVCDELHTLNKSIAIARTKLKKQYPQAAPWEINDMLQMTCFSYIAIENIQQLLKEKTTWIFALTATPGQLYKYDLAKLGEWIHEVQFSQKLRAYEILTQYEYSEIEPILRMMLPENRKRLFYFNTIKELNKYKKILIDCGRQAEAIWALGASPKMDQHALTTRDYILKEHRFPDDVQDLLINGAYETAISIKDPLVKESYIHTGNKDTQVQARNRLRQDLEIVGYYNSDKAKQQKKTQTRAEREQELYNSYVDRIPDEYFNIKLTTELKQELIQLLGFPKKWPSLKKALMQRNYNVTEGNTGNYRYSIIEK